MWSLLNAVFAQKMNVEDREPSIIFEAPIVGGTYGLLAPKLSFWVQHSLLLSVQMIISAGFAVVVYKMIIQKIGSSTSYLTGFGMVIPAVSTIPFWFLKTLDIRSKTLSMSLICLPILVTFRCLEAMFGFTPPAQRKSLKNYVVYYASMMDTIFDPSTQEPAKASTGDLASRIFNFASLFVILSALFSFTVPVSFAPFDTPVDAHSTDHNISDLFRVGHLLNNFIAAGTRLSFAYQLKKMCTTKAEMSQHFSRLDSTLHLSTVLVSVSLSFSTLGSSLLFNLSTGIMTGRVVDNPMFASDSPSNFWGRRWNNLVHTVLKRGVFKPVRKHSSKAVAVAATFLASGVMHEYVWAILFYVHEHEKDPISGQCTSCYQPVWGKNIAFFGWNGVVIALESLIGGFWLFQWMKETLPRPIITALVVMTALPVGHLFTGDWVRGHYFTHFQLGFPIVVRITE